MFTSLVEQLGTFWALVAVFFMVCSVCITSLILWGLFKWLRHKLYMSQTKKRVQQMKDRNTRELADIQRTLKRQKAKAKAKPLSKNTA